MTVEKSGRMISVIIPTYNRCDRLRVALDAVCSQDVEAMEIIVVDNNSRDRTAEVVNAYPDPRVRYTLCTVQGCYPALNHGFALARGDYLTWTSDDNWYHPGALKDMLEALESTGADFACSDYNRLDESTGETELLVVPEPEHLDVECRIGPCFLYRRAVYERLGPYSLRYRWASDYEYWIRIYLAGFRMQPLHSPRYTFTLHSSSDTVMQQGAVLAEGRGRKNGARVERRLIAAWLAHIGETSGAVANVKDLAVSVERGDHEAGSVILPERKA